MIPTSGDVYLRLILDGVFSVDDEGLVWRNKVRRRSGFVDIEPRRAERPNGHGYLMVDQTEAGKTHRIFAHRLAWMASNGRIPDGLFINHINGKKTDNRLANLELVTAAENSQHAYRVLKVGIRYGERLHNSRLTKSDIDEILRLRREGFDSNELSEIFGVKPGTIRDVWLGRNWGWYTGIELSKRANNQEPEAGE